MAQPRAKGRHHAFSVNNIQLTGGEVVFDDRPVKALPVVNGLRLNLPFISTLAYAADIFVRPSFSATFNRSPLVNQGRANHVCGID